MLLSNGGYIRTIIAITFMDSVIFAPGVKLFPVNHKGRDLDQQKLGGSFIIGSANSIGTNAKQLGDKCIVGV